MTLSPTADAFLSLVSAGSCEFLTALRTRPEFVSLDREYGILKALEGHALNQASPQHLPALMAFSKIASTDGLFGYIDSKSWDVYRRMISSRPITAEKLTSLGIIVANINPAESPLRKTFFKFDLNAIVVPYIRDPTMQLSPLTLLSALAGHLWGVTMVAESAVIMAWLMDRQGEYMETTGKFAVVKRMLGTTVAGEAGGRDGHGILGRWRNHVEVFVQRGEWWHDPVAEVAAEGA